MTTQRSMFTDAIEDHLALKKQNAHLNEAMPIVRYDVGEVLDRYPGAPLRTEPTAADAAAAADETSAAGQVLSGEFRRPLDPPVGMTPMLALVEDLDEDDVMSTAAPTPPFAAAGGAATAAATSLLEPIADQGEVLRFPGGAGGARDGEVAATAAAGATGEAAAATAMQATGEQPVIVIDADEPLGGVGTATERATRPQARTSKRPSFFGLRGRRKRDRGGEGAGKDAWFSGGPREFNWDD